MAVYPTPINNRTRKNLNVIARYKRIVPERYRTKDALVTAINA